MSGTNHDHHILEVVTFKLLPGVTEDQFAEANESLSGWAKRQPGFVSRNLAYNESEETYIDVVYWESLAAAQSASDLSMKSEECAPMFGMCDLESVKLVHAVPVTSAVLPASEGATRWAPVLTPGATLRARSAMQLG